MNVGFVIDADTLKKGERLFRQESAFAAGADSYDRLPEENLPEIAFAGRSNVGKSSLINGLTFRKSLARASNTPGRTQQINFFTLGQNACLVDLPGYGYASASKTKVEAWNEFVRNYLIKRKTLRLVVVLVDSRHGLKQSDREVMAGLMQENIQFIVVLTKIDKPKRSDLEQTVADVEAEIQGYPLFAVSAQTTDGLADLRAYLADVYSA